MLFEKFSHKMQAFLYLKSAELNDRTNPDSSSEINDRTNPDSASELQKNAACPKDMTAFFACSSDASMASIIGIDDEQDWSCLYPKISNPLRSD